jgi:hypothetical protein
MSKTTRVKYQENAAGERIVDPDTGDFVPVRNANGSIHVLNEWTPGPDGLTHLVSTGPARGEVTLDDGTTYSVTEDVIQVDSPEHARAVAFHIAKQHEQAGTLTKLVHGDGDPAVGPYDGPLCIVVGDEAAHHIGHEGDVEDGEVVETDASAEG